MCEERPEKMTELQFQNYYDLRWLDALTIKLQEPMVS